MTMYQVVLIRNGAKIPCGVPQQFMSLAEILAESARKDFPDDEVKVEPIA